MSILNKIFAKLTKAEYSPAEKNIQKEKEELVKKMVGEMASKAEEVSEKEKDEAEKLKEYFAKEYNTQEDSK